MKKDVLAKAAKLLGVGKKDLEWIKEAPGHAAAVARLDHLKATTKTNYKKAAKELHPDRTGNDPEKTDLFCVVKDVYRRIESTKIEALEVRSITIPLSEHLHIVSDPMGGFRLQFV